MSEVSVVNNNPHPASTIRAGDTEMSYVSMYSERGYMGDNILRDFVKVTIPSEPLLTAAQLTDLLQNPWTVTDGDGSESTGVGCTTLQSITLTFLKTDDSESIIDELGAAVASLKQEKATIAGENERLTTEKTVLAENVSNMKSAVRAVLKGANDDTLVKLLALMEDWSLFEEDGITASEYEAGEPRKHNGHPYRCIQGHSTDGDANRAPDKAAALWAVYHARSAEHALPYKAPTHAEDIYRAGEFMVFTDGKIYENLSDADWGPDTLPDNWREVGSAGNPVGEQEEPEEPEEPTPEDPEEPTPEDHEEPAPEDPEEPTPEEPTPEPDPEPAKNSNGTLLWSEYVPHDGTHETLYGKDDGVTYFGERYLSLHDNNGNLPSSAGWWVRIS